MEEEILYIGEIRIKKSVREFHGGEIKVTMDHELSFCTSDYNNLLKDIDLFKSETLTTEKGCQK